ncbi:MAG: hypothetical protein AB7N71_15380, partial [Phycisphaerae bacterium]
MKEKMTWGSAIAVFLVATALRANGEDRVYVAGSTSSTIVSFSLATGGDPLIHASPGQAGFQAPQSFAFADDENLIVCEWGIGSIQKYDPVAGEYLQVLVNGGVGGLNLPSGLLLTDAGTMLVSSQFSDSILEFHQISGAFLRVVADSADGLARPRALLRLPDGNIVAANAGSDDLVVLNGLSEEFVRFIARDNSQTPQDESGGLDEPGGIIFDAGSQALLVTSRGTNQVLRFDYLSGNYVGEAVAANAGGLSAPTGMARAPDGTLLVASFGTNNIKRFAADGSFLSDFVAAFAGGIAGPLQLVIVEDDAGGLLGDLNCDGTVTVSDIGGFVLALTNAAGYAAQFPACDIMHADVNGDGQVTVRDIGAFVS